MFWVGARLGVRGRARGVDDGKEPGGGIAGGGGVGQRDAEECGITVVNACRQTTICRRYIVVSPDPIADFAGECEA